MKNSGWDDKAEGGGPPYVEWRWLDRVEQKVIWTSLMCVCVQHTWVTERTLRWGLLLDKCLPTRLLPLDYC